MSNTVLPDEPYYPITRLQHFPKQTRETDPNAARFDPSRPIKLWRDLGQVLTGPTTTYKTWNAGKRQFQEFTVSGAEAATLNIPGEPPYEKRLVEPTPAVVLGPSGAPSGSINPRMLCTVDQAEMLAAEIGGQVVSQSTWSSAAFAIDWRGETRRDYTIKFASLAMNAGLLLAERWKQGVNYPGHWEFTGSLGSPQFYPDPIPSTVGIAETPLPYRDLAAGQEAIYEGSPFGTAIVYRLDMESIYNPAAGTGGADQITLLKIQEDIAEIKRLQINLNMALGLGG